MCMYIKSGTEIFFNATNSKDYLLDLAVSLHSPVWRNLIEIITMAFVAPSFWFISRLCILLCIINVKLFLGGFFDNKFGF